VLNSEKIKEIIDEYHPVLWEFNNVFPEEVLGLPLKRYLDCSIDIVLGKYQHRGFLTG
jgi:hypothetical protein